MLIGSKSQTPIFQVAPQGDARNQQAIELLEHHDVDAAIDLLQAPTQRDQASPDTLKLLGSAYFLKERYADAGECFQQALAADPKNAQLQEQLALARANNATGAQFEPQVHPFVREQLLAAPQPGAHAQGPNFVEPLPTSKLGKALQAVKSAALHAVNFGREIAGGCVGGLFAVTCRALGKQDSREIWTTWSHKNFATALLQLGNLRDKLEHTNLHSPYPKGELVGFAEPGQIAPESTKFARTADGSWNNPLDPKEGAAGTRFSRNVDPALTARPSDEEILSPNPREVSRELLTRDNFKEVPFLNMLAATWIQFQVHDWVSHGDADQKGLYEIPMAPDDPFRQKFHMTDMLVPRTASDPTRQASEEGTPEGHLNEVTHWWDGSQIYGSDVETQNSMRSFRDGKMKLDEKGNIPVGKNGIEETGFTRNWWLGLSLLHDVFVREHNDICDMLKKNHPDWDDQRTFDVARLINAAEMAKIHTTEWTPAILPNPTLNAGMQSNWSGALSYYTHKAEGRPTLETLAPKSQVLGGIVGNKTEKFGAPYALSEEFTAVYRLHSLLPDVIRIQKINEDAPSQDIPLADTRLKASHKITDTIPMADLLNSFGTQQPGQLVLNNYPKTLQELSIPAFAAFDLGAVDILRDRERGIPRYNEFRRQLNLHPITKFEDLTDDPEQVAKLKKVYDNDIEKIDLLVGTLAETHRPDGYGFGETMFSVFVLNASRRLQADRFFTESYNAETYTQEGLDRIDNTSMKSLLLRNFPELGESGLSNVKNAFEPWDKGELTTERHPLNQFRA